MHPSSSGNRRFGGRPLRPAARLPRVTVGLDLGPHARLGPGKVRLLEAVAAEGSISAAARAVGMSYRHAWKLLSRMNEAFRQPLIASTTGGAHGGGAALTPFGADVVRRYQLVERQASAAAAPHLAALADETR
jgi:molybdate transport system regulatory protein